MNSRITLALGAVFFVASFVSVAEAEDDGTSIAKKLLENYKKGEPPTHDNATEVKVGVYAQSISFDDKSKGLRLRMYFRQSWNDPRLAFKQTNKRLEKIRLPDDSIWVPDTFFRNEISSSFHDVTVRNRLVHLKQNGNIWYVLKLTSTFDCPMRLQAFPFDVQHCPILIESFGYTADVISYSWMEQAFDIDESLQIPEFFLTETISTDCTQNYTAGAYPCLQLGLVLKRQYGYYLLQYFLPALILVLVSWLSFLMSPQDATPRVLIGLVTILALMLLKTKLRDSINHVSYCTAGDVWMGACLLFVDLALVETVFANRNSKPSTGESKEEESKIPKWIPNFIRGKNETSVLDKISLVAFPSAFLLFNIFYWIIYVAIQT